MRYPVLGPIPNGAGAMVLRVVFLFLVEAPTLVGGVIRAPVKVYLTKH